MSIKHEAVYISKSLGQMELPRYHGDFERTMEGMPVLLAVQVRSLCCQLPLVFGCCFFGSAHLAP